MGSRNADQHHLDLRGTGLTTEIVTRAISRLDAMSPGEALFIRVDAAEAIDNDLRSWCEATGNHLVRVDDNGDSRIYVIEKGVPMSVVHRLALVISSPEHDHLEAPLSLALAAALEGVDASIFFEGPAVRLLAPAPDPGRRWFRRAKVRALDEARNQLQQIHDLGGHLYVSERSLAEFGLSHVELAFGRIIHAEYLTFLPVMEEADIQLLA
ncbi:MAG: sulfurtransferase TusA family protein [Acidimicrobiia bacterium]